MCEIRIWSFWPIFTWNFLLSNPVIVGQPTWHDGNLTWTNLLNRTSFLSNLINFMIFLLFSFLSLFIFLSFLFLWLLFIFFLIFFPSVFMILTHPRCLRHPPSLPHIPSSVVNHGGSEISAKLDNLELCNSVELKS